MKLQTLVILYIASYFASAFITWELNPGAWSFHARFLLVFFFFIETFLYLLSPATPENRGPQK